MGRYKTGDIHDSAGRLRRTVFVGDHVRMKADAPRRDYLAVYQFNPEEIRTVTRIDTGTMGRRLYVDGAPHMFYAGHVELVWNTPAERRQALLAVP